MNTAETMRAVTARSPRGCSRPVLAQVTEAERATIETISQREGRSISATARMLLLRGLERYESDSLVAD